MIAADIKVERLMEPEEAEVCLRYILKYTTRRGSNIFHVTREKKDHFVASRRRWLEHQGKRVALWHDIKTPLPQQSSPSSRDEEAQWISVEDRRRRRVAFEKAA